MAQSIMHTRRLVGAGLAALLAAPVSSSAGSPRTRYALIIGNNYEQSLGILAQDKDGNATPPLMNPANDCALIAKVVKDVGFEPGQPLLNCGIDNFRSSCRSFMTQIHDADIALIYIAGHGIQMGPENWYLLNDGASFASIPVLIETIRNEVDSRGAVVCLLDTCRNNPISELVYGLTRADRPLDRASVPATRLHFERIYKYDSEVKSYALNALTNNDLLDLGRVEPRGENAAFVFATDATNTAADIVAGQPGNGPFARAIARHIRERASFSSVVTMMTNDVNGTSGGKSSETSQHLWIKASLRREIFLAGKPPPRSTLAPLGSG
ncbi:MAG TPA: caspase family protein [Caulobacteraceae bacterium]|nr:caspase family protein [Caulobacteraceae bacterium]